MFTSNADIEGDLVIFVLLGSLKDLISTWHNILYAKSGKIVTQTAESPGHTMNVVWHSCFLDVLSSFLWPIKYGRLCPPPS